MLIGFIFRAKLLKNSSESNKQDDFYLVLSETFVQRCSVKKVFLETSQDSQEKTFARASFFKIVVGFSLATLLKKNFAKSPIYIDPLCWLLLCYWKFNTKVAISNFFERLSHLIDDDDELLLWYGWPTKGV